MRGITQIEMAGGTVALRAESTSGDIVFALHFKASDYRPSMRSLCEQLLDKMDPPKCRLKMIAGGARGSAALAVTAALLGALPLG